VEDDGANQSKEMKSMKPLLAKSLKASQLTSSRNAIQQKYLKDLKSHVSGESVAVVEVPLLPSEVTGAKNLLDFSKLLLENPGAAEETTASKKSSTKTKTTTKLYEDDTAATDVAEETAPTGKDDPIVEDIDSDGNSVAVPVNKAKAKKDKKNKKNGLDTGVDA